MSGRLRDQLDAARKAYHKLGYDGDLASQALGEADFGRLTNTQRRRVMRIGWGIAAAMTAAVIAVAASLVFFASFSAVSHDPISNTVPSNVGTTDAATPSAARPTIPTVRLTPPRPPASVRSRPTLAGLPDLRLIPEQTSLPRLRWTLRRSARNAEPDTRDPADSGASRPSSRPAHKETLS